MNKPNRRGKKSKNSFSLGSVRTAKNAGDFSVFIDDASSQDELTQIDGATTYVLGANYEAVTFYSDGVSKWSTCQEDKPQAIRLGKQDSEAFADALANPKPPSDRLKKAAERSKKARPK